MISVFADHESIPESTLERCEMLKSMLVDRATGGAPSESVYRQLRNTLLENATAKELLPRWIKTHRSLSEFWGFIQPKFPSYAGRREFIRQEFEPVLARLESMRTLPVDSSANDTLSVVDSEHVVGAWERAAARKDSDPEGAITASRTLLETVCKHILAEFGHHDLDAHDLPKLYAITANELQIAPSQHTEEAFKRILGSCSSLVEGLATLRNRLGDSHGKAPGAVRPAPRHARLAVNIAGSMAVFLMETFEARMSTRRAS
jgi:hypothetical protein